MKYHPDKCNGSDAEKQKYNDRFKKISHAYDILKDKDKRQNYDRFGEEGMQQMGGDFNSDPFDMFQNFFNGGRNRVKKSKDKVRDMKITLEEIYNKSVKNLQINQKVCCSTCDGSGAYSSIHVIKCKFCNGKGNIGRVINLGIGQQLVSTTCDNCNGEGKIVNKNCEKCKGSKTEMKETKVKLEITNEFRTGKKIMFSEMSDYQPGCDINGDLILVVEVTNHSVFELQNNNLIMKKTISLSEALCGTHFNITHLDKRKISIKTNGIINPYQEYYISGEGIDGGDLIIKFTINFPTQIEESTKNQLSKLFPIQTQEPLLDKIKHIDVRNKHRQNTREHTRQQQQQEEGGVECNNQ